MTNNTFTLTFHLQQHTPIIHFQHEQEGATLRATELKPKLDRFIVEDLQKINPVFYKKHCNTIKNFFSQNTDDKKNRGYKLKVLPTKIQKWCYVADLDKKQRFSPKFVGHLLSGTAYFADNDKLKEEKFEEIKKALWFEGKDNEGKKYHVELQVFSLNKEVLDLIKVSVPYFMACTNFGCRSNKGFGSFTCIESTSSDIELALKKVFIDVFKKNTQSSGVANPLELISKDYKILKAKYDSGSKTTKSELKNFIKKDYENNEDWSPEWEKDVVKSEVVNGQEHESFDNALYMRALLGLANIYQYPKDEVKNVFIKWVPNIQQQA